MRVKSVLVVCACSALSLAAGYFAGERYPTTVRSEASSKAEELQSLPPTPPERSQINPRPRS